MATPVELRHLCLLLSAGSMVYHKRGATLPAAVRCALYLLLAFALRRGNLGRDLLRGTTSHSHNYPSTHPRRPSHPTFTSRWAAPLFTQKDKHGSPHPSCI
ncbi:MAG TPA: hypothetical protein VEY08_13340 [Chloroflexia bacterium]|nr:hypothetical protein [Chloroflexia bacterium]